MNKSWESWHQMTSPLHPSVVDVLTHWTKVEDYLRSMKAMGFEESESLVILSSYSHEYITADPAAIFRAILACAARSYDEVPLYGSEGRPRTE